MSNMEIDRVLAQIRSIPHTGSTGGVGAARVADAGDGRPVGVHHEVGVRAHRLRLGGPAGDRLVEVADRFSVGDCEVRPGDGSRIRGGTHAPAF